MTQNITFNNTSKLFITEAEVNGIYANLNFIQGTIVIKNADFFYKFKLFEYYFNDDKDILINHFHNLLSNFHADTTTKCALAKALQI